MKNPFVIQRPIRYGEPFCDRKEEIDYLLKAARLSEAVCILSIRRFGKTSLINQVLGKLEDQGWITIKIDLSQCHSLEELVFKLGQNLQVLKSKKERFLERIKKIAEKAKKIRPQLTTDPVTLTPVVSFDFSQAYSSRVQLEKILKEMVSLPRQSKLFLCVVFDEFQNIRKIDPEGKIEWIFRSVFQERDENFVPFFLGSEKHLLQMMILEETSAFFKSITPLELHSLKPPEVISFVKEEFKKTLQIFPSEEKIARISCLFGGHPYVLNWFWAEVWEKASYEEKNLQRSEVWIETAVKIILNQRNFYEAINLHLPLNAQKVLKKIAFFEPVKSPFSKEFMIKTCGLTQGSLQSALKILFEEDKIKKTKEGIILVDPLERLIIKTAHLDEEGLVNFLEQCLCVKYK